MQDVLMRKIHAIVGGKQQTVINIISDVLDVSYDSAYRRVKNQTQLNLSEIAELCKHFKISVDELILLHDKNYLLTELPKKIESEVEVIDWLINSKRVLQPYANNRNGICTYFAKDIPVFYTLRPSLIGKFKFYVWQWISSLSFQNTKILFKDFQLKKEIANYSSEINFSYKSINSREIWSESTISSVLMQIRFFYQINIITFDECKILFDELLQIINQVKKYAEQGQKEAATFELYVCELLVLDNSLFLVDKEDFNFLVPYDVVNYFNFNQNDNLLDQKHKYVTSILNNSISLTSANAVNREIFFQRLLSSLRDFEHNYL